MQHVTETLTNIEGCLLLSLKTGKGLEMLHRRLESVLSLAAIRVEQGHFLSGEILDLNEQVARIQNIAIFFGALDTHGKEMLQKAQKDAFSVSNEIGRSEFDFPRFSHQQDRIFRKTIVKPQDDSLSSKLLRQWFLDNLADPFPSKRTKGELVDKTNALVEAASPATARAPLSMKPIDTQQCSLWFVNSRRRSGWTDFQRRYAQSEKSIMLGVIDSLKAEEGLVQPGRNSRLESILEMNADGFKCSRVELSSRVEQCREAYASMLDWLHQRKKEEVGDWMAEVIEEARQEVKQSKAAARLERKRADEGTKEEIVVRRQKRKANDAPSSSESDAGEPRPLYRNLRRRTVHKRSKGQLAKPSTMISKPDSFFDQGCTSEVRTTLGNSDGSRRVPSLTHSEGSTSRSSSSSSATSIVSSASSLSVYPKTLETHGSPTLRILRNSQPKNSDHTMMVLPPGCALRYTPLDCAASKPTDETYSLTPVPLVLPDWLQVPTSEPNLRHVPRSEL